MPRSFLTSELLSHCFVLCLDCWSTSFNSFNNCVLKCCKSSRVSNSFISISAFLNLLRFKSARENWEILQGWYQPWSEIFYSRMDVSSSLVHILISSDSKVHEWIAGVYTVGSQLGKIFLDTKTVQNRLKIIGDVYLCKPETWPVKNFAFVPKLGWK